LIIKKRTVFIVAVLRLENIFQRRQSTEMKQWETGRESWNWTRQAMGWEREKMLKLVQ